ncbi:class I SAM-dependent methyltransferase [Candidatus Parabeggiatoa sp. HSG14]|uniref:class I SAM-dependent methyltransferase n=1 Tax=Candidatus Parabeggiatoa sp. HSG14 TaxID=3055593 RepID=UPI0025A86873|nr:class I SAM-dependent methyltransferase [Thiotrichales bacterium HSG14]
MFYRNIKKTLAKIRHTPLHPQWIVYRNEHQYHSQIGEQVTGTVLDIGCADQHIKKYIQNSNYIGLDYYQTATHWYGTQPDVYGDAQTLPFADNSMDTVLLLDVLEHLPHPKDCISEIARVLKPTGLLVLQVPFIYPIHDAPLDFQRWTQYGLEQLVSKYGFTTRQKITIGKPLETAGLLLNIAISKTILNWLRKKNPALILGILAPMAILSINFFCWLFSFLSPMDEMMPHSYRLILEKQ